MKIINLEKIDSTHTYIRDYIRENGYKEPLAVVTRNQTNGIGSRGNSWIGMEGNLFFSFVFDKEDLPKDLPIQSSSIYFSFLLAKILKENGSNVWLKWPNDFYMENKKIGGTITTLSGDLIYCGIGLNLITDSEEYGKLDIKISVEKLLEEYFDMICQKVSWKQIFSEYKIEFQKSKDFSATIDNKKEPLKNATLNDDGSIIINNKKVFSLR